MAEPIIKLKDLEITYNLGKVNEFKATRGVTMDIYPGEFVAFFGPSGCGKSTIFYSILDDKILNEKDLRTALKDSNPIDDVEQGFKKQRQAPDSHEPSGFQDPPA